MELIRIDEKGLVNARELYEFLEVKKDFTDWFKYRVGQYDFEEEKDFTTILGKSTGGRPSKDFAITIDMAKELSMVENNEKGRAARKYFIKCENKLKEIVQPKRLSPMDQLKLQYEVLEEHEHKIDDVIERVGKIENNTIIDYSQQEELRTLGTNKVIAILGGTDAPAYKELNKKVFSSFWRDYKRKLRVNSYKNTLVKDFEKGRQVIINWQPTKEVTFMIDGCNAQMRM